MTTEQEQEVKQLASGWREAINSASYIGHGAPASDKSRLKAA